MSAAITPGIQPKKVKMHTKTKFPSPLSITAKGGNIIQSKTRKQPII